MSKISPNSPLNAAATPKPILQQVSTARAFQLTATLPRMAIGLTAALAGVSAAFFIFGAFSDLSAIQLATGPHGSAIGSDGKPIVLARTGRSWGVEAEHRSAAASAVQVARLAPVGTMDAAYRPRASK